MYSGWWRLPGPSRFVARAERELRAGQSLVLRLPPTCAEGLRQAIASAIRECELLRWAELDLAGEDPALSPASLLCRRFMFRPPCVESADAFVSDSSNAGLVIWVDGMSSTAWLRWKPFLEEFSHAGRNANGNQPRLCIPLNGEAATALPALGAGVASMDWRDGVDLLDTMLFVRSLNGQSGEPPPIRSVMESITVELAGSDALLAVSLSGLPPESVCDPLASLRSIAEQRSWPARSMHGDWLSGGYEYWNGRLRRHSLSCARTGGENELRSRVWKGQLSVVFPLVEELRGRLARDLHRYWRLPLETRFGTITDPLDLEVSHMLWLARRRAPPGTLRLLECLTEIRHSLAHLRPVPLAVLRVREFLAAAEQLGSRPGQGD